MPISDLLMTGVNLMLMGMGIVFLFLVLLVFSMLGMSKLARVFDAGREPEHRIAPQPVVAVSGHQQGARGDLVAAIAVAISRYRAKHH